MRPRRIHLVGGPQHGRGLSRVDIEHADEEIRVTVINGWLVATDTHPMFRRDPELAARCTWTTYRLATARPDGTAQYRAIPPASHESRRLLVEQQLHDAGVRNVRRIHVPAAAADRWAVQLDDTTTSSAAARALKEIPGVSDVRRGRHSSATLTFTLHRPEEET